MKALLPKKNYLRIKSILLTLFLFCFYYCLSHAGIKQEIYPFAIGFFIALMWCNKGKIINCLLFSICAFLWQFDIYYFISAVIYACSIFFVLEFFKRKNKHITSLQYTCISSLLLICFLPFYLYFNTPILNIFYTFFLAIIFYLSICKCFKTLLTKGINVKLNLDEIVCACFILISLGCGLAEINFLNISLIKPIGILLIFISALVCQTSGPLIIGASLGIGYTLNFNSLEFISILTFFALIAIIFKNNKYYLGLSLIAIELVLGLYFKVFGSYNLINFAFTFAPILIIIILPQKYFENIKLFLNGSDTSYSSRNIIERSKKSLSKRFLEISNAFFEIHISFKNSIKTKLPKEEAINVLKQELIKNVCLNCKNKDRCLTILKEHTINDINAIIETGFQKQKISILDMPSFLNSHCNKINLLISTTNNLIKSYNNFIADIEEKNSGKLLLLEELDGLQKMFLKLSKNIQENTFYDFSKEDELKENLNYNNINVKDVILIIENNKNFELSLLIHEKDIDKPNFLSTINKTLKAKMEIVSIQKSNIDKYNTVYLKQCSKYNCIYGVSGSNKFNNDVSGDNFSCVKLDRNKVLFAICDGMGNGELAQAHSEHTINLIENFYKAGFPYENIIELVNKLITIESEDVFSALDIAILNLDNGKTDFIKLGSQESFIKDNNSIQIISGDSLPMGIVQEIKPSINSRIITSDNIVFMCSDGVIDCLGYDNLCSFLERTKTKNPQALCDEIVNLAIKNSNGKPKDDITALAFKLFLN